MMCIVSFLVLLPLDVLRSPVSITSITSSCSKQVSEKAKSYARERSKTFEELDSESTHCQACTRFPELEQYIDGELPTEFDWREYGAVTKVKNQVRSLLELWLC